jgi:hypothetical protein
MSDIYDTTEKHTHTHTQTQTNKQTNKESKQIQKQTVPFRMLIAAEVPVMVQAQGSHQKMPSQWCW